MSTPFYDLASLVVVPSGYKASKVYAQKPLTTDGQLTFSRASTATRVNNAGLIETVSSNVPRLDYQGSTCPKLLLEPQRTNLFTYNSAFDNAAWTKNESTISANAATSPDGTSNADKMVPSVNSGAQYITQDLSITSGTTYTQTIYAKADGYSFVQMTGSISFPGNYANFNLANGTLGSTDGGTATITSVGNGWYRLRYTLTAIATTTGRIIVALVSSASSGRLNSFAGNGTSGVLLYGAQLEVGAYPTSLIPTTTAAVTRLADACSKTGISSLIGQTEGTLFVEFVSGADDATTHIMSLSDGTTNNRVSLVKNTSDDLRAFVASGGASQASILWPNYAPNTNIKAAISYKANEIRFYVNGENAGSDLIALVPASLTRVEFETSGSPFAYPVKQLIVFPTALTPAQLAELTTL